MVKMTIELNINEKRKLGKNFQVKLKHSVENLNKIGIYYIIFY